MHQRIAIIEDTHLVAVELHRIVSQAGHEVAGSATTLDEALELIEHQRFDAVILDVDLGGQPAWPVAEALQRQGVPFVFISGYGVDSLPPEFRSCAFLGKPFGADELQAKLRELFEK